MQEYYPEGILSEQNTVEFTPSFLASAIANKTVLEAPALMCDAEHNLIVDLGCMRGVIPRNEGAIGMADGTTRDIALISRVGRPVCFIATDFYNDKNGRPTARLSRKLAQERCREHLLNPAHLGDVIEARVTHLESFGAFCDVGCGNVALLPIDAISVSRISHPKDRFTIGDRIKVVLRDVADDGKITLTHKELLGTWAENAERFRPGETVPGVIRSIEDYGVFVELTPNLAGLAEPRPGVRIGQQASVYIKNVIPEKMKIKLIIIDSFEAGQIQPMHYYYDAPHIDEWHYSPTTCCKQIVSAF